MENKKLPRREREKLRQRQEMLAAALELFSEKGYHNVSMHEIAEKAEFAIGTLYKFFKNKEDLYKALVLEQSDKFHDALTKAIEEPDDEIEKLRNYVKAKGEVFRDNVSMIRLYFAETHGASFNVMAGLDREIRERYGRLPANPRVDLRKRDEKETVQEDRRPVPLGRCPRKPYQRLSFSLA